MQRIYQVISPPRVVSCAEYGCAAFLNGWQTIVPPEKAGMVRSLRGRYDFTETAADAGLVAFTFPPGQECFTGRAGMHRLPWEGRERFFERPDRRAAATQLRADDWVDSFANHQIRLADQIRRG